MTWKIEAPLVASGRRTLLIQPAGKAEDMYPHIAVEGRTKTPRRTTEDGKGHCMTSAKHADDVYFIMHIS